MPNVCPLLLPHPYPTYCLTYLPALLPTVLLPTYSPCSLPHAPCHRCLVLPACGPYCSPAFSPSVVNPWFCPTLSSHTPVPFLPFPTTWDYILPVAFNTCTDFPIPVLFFPLHWDFTYTPYLLCSARVASPLVTPTLPTQEFYLFPFCSQFSPTPCYPLPDDVLPDYTCLYTFPLRHPFVSSPTFRTYLLPLRSLLLCLPPLYHLQLPSFLPSLPLQCPPLLPPPHLQHSPFISLVLPVRSCLPFCRFYIVGGISPILPLGGFPCTHCPFCLSFLLFMLVPLTCPSQVGFPLPVSLHATYWADPSCYLPTPPPGWTYTI